MEVKLKGTSVSFTDSRFRSNQCCFHSDRKTSKKNLQQAFFSENSRIFRRYWFIYDPSRRGYTQTNLSHFIIIIRHPVSRHDQTLHTLKPLNLFLWFTVCSFGWKKKMRSRSRWWESGGRLAVGSHLPLPTRHYNRRSLHAPLVRQGSEIAFFYPFRSISLVTHLLQSSLSLSLRHHIQAQNILHTACTQAAATERRWCWCAPL